MKKTIFLLMTLIYCVSMNAQVIKVCKGTEVVATYTPSQADNVIFEESQSDSHEYVDLGLSVKWATMNIGAENIYDHGEYFAWGETSGYNEGKTDFSKINFSISTYVYYKSAPDDTVRIQNADGSEEVTIVSHKGFTKYVRSSDASAYGYDGFYDDKTTLESSDDAATVNWGSRWRMPTKAEWEELNNKCKWTWGMVNGVSGYKVSASNGNYIFLPVGGFRVNFNCNVATTRGHYWSSTLYKDCSGSASCMFFRSDVRWISDSDETNRSHGRNVRAVFSE